MHEAIELRDGDKNRYLGKGVKNAVQNINELIKKEVIDKNFENYKAFDKHGAFADSILPIVEKGKINISTLFQSDFNTRPSSMGMYTRKQLPPDSKEAKILKKYGKYIQTEVF